MPTMLIRGGFFSVNIYVDRTVSTLVNELMHQANDLDCSLNFKRVEDEGYVISNEEGARVVAVGIFNMPNEFVDDEAVVGAFTINVKAYKWADAEGFSLDDMIDEENLQGRIFNLIGVDRVLHFLCDKK